MQPIESEVEGEAAYIIFIEPNEVYPYHVVRQDGQIQKYPYHAIKITERQQRLFSQKFIY